MFLVTESCPTQYSPPGSSVLGFSRQEYWSGLTFRTPGDLPNTRMEPQSPALVGGFFTTEPLLQRRSHLCLCHSGAQHQKVLGGQNTELVSEWGGFWLQLSGQPPALGSGQSHFSAAVTLNSGDSWGQRGLRITLAVSLAYCEQGILGKTLPTLPLISFFSK